MKINIFIINIIIIQLSLSLLSFTVFITGKSVIFCYFRYSLNNFNHHSLAVLSAP